MANLFDTKLIDLMPENYQNIDQIRWLCASVQPQIDEVLEIIRYKIIFTNLDKLDDLTLDYLLLECGIAGSIEIIFIKSREDKIKFISNYVTLNKLRGTKAGIEYALKMLDVTAEITEWFEDPEELEPYWFKIKIISDKILSDDELRLLRAYIKEYKNTRSWYKTEIKHTYESDIYAAAVLKRRYTIKSKADYVTSIQSDVYASVVNKTKISIRGTFDVS